MTASLPLFTEPGTSLPGSPPLFQAEPAPVPVAVPAPAPAPALLLTPEPAAVGEVLDAEPTTRVCDYPGCGEVFTGAEGGKNSAPMQLGKHRWGKHKLRKDDPTPAVAAAPAGKSGKSSGPVVDVGTDPHPISSTLAAVGKSVTGTGVPRAEQLAKAFGIGLSVVTQGAARWAVGTDPLMQLAVAQDPAAGEVATEQMVGALSLSQETAAQVLAPVARLLAPTALNRKYGRAVVENTDLGPALVELADVGRVWMQYLGQRRQALAELRQMQAQQIPVGVTPAAQAAAAATGPGSAVPPPHRPVDPTLGAGRVAVARH